jgi:Na+-translocating ferredoxin:NAD+ oxidoreductase RnfC subunit
MIEATRAKGVVGAGGAGFPTYKKLERTAEIVILNAAECEPLLHKDKELLKHFGGEVLDGMAAVVRHVQAREGIVAVKGKYQDLLEQLEPEARARGLRLHPLGDFYPSGDEFVTVHECTGRVVPPGGLPLDVGCLVGNVETMLNVSRPGPVTHKYLTVAGAVPEPMTVRVPVGTTYRATLAAAGVDVDALGSVLVGGVMMGKLMASPDEVVTRTTGGFVCLPHGHRLGERYAAKPPQRARIGKSACDQCSFCTEMCPRYLLGHPLEPHKAMRNLMFHEVGPSLILGSQFCSECNLCSLFACPEDLFPKDACVDNKRFLREQNLRHPGTGLPTKPHSMQEFRHIPLSSLIKKLGLMGFRNVGPLTEVGLAPDQVRVPLRMHVGEPAVACVAPGATVRVGDEIGRAPAGLGVPVHASVAGVVESVGAEVVIRRTDV